MQGQQDQDAMGMGSMIREVQELAEKFKVEEDEQYISPYAQLEKATVLQEARYVIIFLVFYLLGISRIILISASIVFSDIYLLNNNFLFCFVIH